MNTGFRLARLILGVEVALNLKLKLRTLNIKLKLFGKSCFFLFQNPNTLFSVKMYLRILSIKYLIL